MKGSSVVTDVVLWLGGYCTRVGGRDCQVPRAQVVRRRLRLTGSCEDALFVAAHSCDCCAKGLELYRYT